MMRYFIATIGLALAMPAHAADDPMAQIRDRYCAQVGKVAEGMMEMRQVGDSLADALEVVDGSSVVSVDLREVVLDAWSRPRWVTHSSQTREVEEFRDKWHLKCLRDGEP